MELLEAETLCKVGLYFWLRETLKQRPRRLCANVPQIVRKPMRVDILGENIIGQLDWQPSPLTKRRGSLPRHFGS